MTNEKTFADLRSAVKPNDSSPGVAIYFDPLTLDDFREILRLRSIDLLDIREGDTILHIGHCDERSVVLLSRLVGETGLVSNLCIDNSVFEVNIKKYISPRIKLKFGLYSKQQLEFDDNQFDSCLTDLSFNEFDESLITLREIVRTVKKESRFSIPYGEPRLSVNGISDQSLTNKVLNCLYRSSASKEQKPISINIVRDALKLVGLQNISVAPVMLTSTNDILFKQIINLAENLDIAISAGHISRTEAKMWEEHLVIAKDNGIFSFTISDYVLVGRKR